MAKKKKLNPVARGFATTSVPKKVIRVVEEPEEETPSEPVNEPIAGRHDTNLNPEGTQHPASDEFDPDKVEEQSLQNLIDKYQEKTEKEVVRTIKAIEQERRYSQTFLPLELDPVFIDRILELSIQLESNEEAKKTIDSPEEKAIVRLAVTYGSLRRLGFSEERVEECLKAINGIELDEAIQWLHLHCSVEELGSNSSTVDIEPKTPKSPKTPRSFQNLQTSRTVTSSTSSLPPRKKGARLDANAPSFVPFNKPNAASYPLSSTTSLGDSDTHIARSPTSVSESESESSTDNMISEYVRLKIQITDITSHRRLPGEHRDAGFLYELKTRLNAIQKDYFFDEREAEALYRVERAKADAIALQSKLRGTDPSETTSAPKVPTIVPPAQAPPKPELPTTSTSDTTMQPTSDMVPDIFDDNDDDLGGGLLQLLEDMPQTETSEQGVTIRIREMALPKHWSGRTPKSLLEETVHKVDRYAAISYRCISGSSRAKRAAVSIRWEGAKTGDWTMEDIACYDMHQAEQYVATVALHALSFPTLDGFASGGSAVGGQTSFRLLPAIFRDLWDELEASRRTHDDAVNRSVWSKLRSILEPKLNPEGKLYGKDPKQLPDTKDSNTSRNAAPNGDVISEQILAGFIARQNSPSYQEMLSQRNQLPIAQYREEIISTLAMSQVLVLSGETGCGKSTQVPAFILEDQISQGKHCKIYCTEPRRISAISLAQRVSRELGEPAGAVGTQSSIVGYSIRLEANISRSTRLAYVTNGIALRMLESGSGKGGQGTAFDEITHIIIDEVHERTIESDFLLIVLRSMLDQRPDLKIILMSATVNAEKISNYFGGCPILRVPGRTFPVETRFLEDAIELTQWKIAENSPYARRGDKYGRGGKARVEWSEDTAPGDDDDEEPDQENVKLEKRYSQSTATTINRLDERTVPYDLIVRLLEHICLEDPDYQLYSSAILIFMPGMGEIRRLNDLLQEHSSFGSPRLFSIFPLHSTISSEQQGAVFDLLPRGMRKIVIATNIAETGITIPDITCVIDTGKHREMRFDEKRQVSRLVETYISKSNAAQRRGRAGRVQSGLCFHLFTKIRHNKMADHPDPEMMRLSLSDLALRIKIMKVNLGSSIEDVLSKAMDPPLSVNIQRSISALAEVGALTSTEDITPLGRLLSKLPTDVHLGKFLLVAALFRCLDPALTIAATLNAKSPFLSPLGSEHEAELAKHSFRTENSDFLTIHNAFASWRRACANGIAFKFCRKNFLSHQNLQQIEELRQQFLGYLVDSSFIQVDASFIKDLSRARYARNRTRVLSLPPELDVNSGNVALINAALCAGLYPKILAIASSGGKDELRVIGNNSVASFHPSSINFRRRAKDFGVNHLCYFTLMQSKKLYAWETSPIDDLSLLLLCGEPEFKLMSHSVIIDRKIKFRIDPKSSVALKLLRNQLGPILAAQFRVRPLTESQLLWNDVAMMVLGKTKPKDPDSQEGSNITLVSGHAINPGH